MKTIHRQHQPSRQGRRSGYTLLETMVSIGIFLGIFVGVMVGLQVFGLRVYTLAATKLSATADGRKTLDSMREAIRSAKLVYVGSYMNGVFSRVTNGLPQTGNALQIYYGDLTGAAGTNPVIYYQTSNNTTNALFRVGRDGVKRMANYMTNYYVFTAEDYQAIILTNYNNNPVIRITMEFYQWEYPIGFVGTNGVNAYDFYRLQTRVSRRAKD